MAKRSLFFVKIWAILGALISICSTTGFAAPSDMFTSGFMPMAPESSESSSPTRQLYYQFKPASHGQPTFVLLNGLTYDTRFWRSTVEALLQRNPNAGILLFDFWGQGKTLLNAVARAPWIQLQSIPAERQAKDYILLTRNLVGTGPIIAVGLSYGGGIALLAETIDPDLTSQTVLVAPFLEPAADQDAWIRYQIKLTRITFPFNPASDDQLYDYFLRQLIYTTYPAVEPVILENPFKLEALYRMVQGIRQNIGTELITHLPSQRKLHLVQPLNDQYIAQSVFDRFWSALPGPKRASRLLLENTQHKVPEDQPRALAHWINLISQDPAKYQKGKTWTLDPRTIQGLGDNCEVGFKTVKKRTTN